jgi:DNA (cytosine-5)-methyltransferase 1
MAKDPGKLTVLEICAGAGGQACGLEQAGFDHTTAVEIQPEFADTLRLNRGWNVVTGDVQEFDGRPYKGIDLLAGGMPCPPFSIAGKQLGADDERDLFPTALRLVAETKPTAVLLENVRGLAGVRFSDYRQRILADLYRMDYESHWQVLNASEFGVPQLRPRFILVAIKKRYARRFRWPTLQKIPPRSGKQLAI